MDDYCERQSECYIKARDSINAIGKSMEELNYIVNALYYVGNVPLARKIEIVIEDVNIHIKNIKDAKSQQLDNYMKMSRDSDKEFMQTIFNTA